MLNILHILLGSKSGTWSTLGDLTVQYKGKTLQKIVAHDNSNDKAEMLVFEAKFIYLITEIMKSRKQHYRYYW